MGKHEAPEEAKLREWCKDNGGDCLKMYETGWPDRMVVLYSYVAWFELKAEGREQGRRKGEKLQLHIKKRLLSMGHRVYTVTTAAEAIEVIQNDIQSQSAPDRRC